MATSVSEKPDVYGDEARNVEFSYCPKRSSMFVSIGDLCVEIDSNELFDAIASEISNKMLMIT